MKAKIIKYMYGVSHGMEIFTYECLEFYNINCRVKTYLHIFLFSFYYFLQIPNALSCTRTNLREKEASPHDLLHMYKKCGKAYHTNSPENKKKRFTEKKITAKEKLRTEMYDSFGTNRTISIESHSTYP